MTNYKQKLEIVEPVAKEPQPPRHNLGMGLLMLPSHSSIALAVPEL